MAVAIQRGNADIIRAVDVKASETNALSVHEMQGVHSAARDVAAAATAAVGVDEQASWGLTHCPAVGCPRHFISPTAISVRPLSASTHYP